jgi:hypothetical protein
VPTIAQWEGVIENNTEITVGTWSNTRYDSTNYSAARYFGSDLMLPAAGFRNSNSGILEHRGSYGLYWSSSESSNAGAWDLWITNGPPPDPPGNSRLRGLSVRCVAEDSSQPQPLSLGKTSLSLDAGGSESVSISGGTGYYSASSNNSQVATAVISGSSVEVTSLSLGETTITVKDTDGNTATISVSVYGTFLGDPPISEPPQP